MNDYDLNKKFISMLEDKPDTTNFSNGEGYVLQDPDIISEIRKYFLDRYNNYYVAGRSLDDGDSPLYESFMRVYTVDKQYREWGQPYFKSHTEKAIQHCLNHEFEIKLKCKLRKRKLEQIEDNK